MSVYTGARRHQHRPLRHEAGTPDTGLAESEFLRTAIVQTLGEEACAMSLETDFKAGPGWSAAGSATSRGAGTNGIPPWPAKSAARPSAPQWSAVELPDSWRKAYQRALARLPEMSVILYHDETQADGGRMKETTRDLRSGGTLRRLH